MPGQAVASGRYGIKVVHHLLSLLIFVSSSSPDVSAGRCQARSKWHRSRPSAYLIRVSMVPELFDVVHQAVKLSLPIHLIPPAQREAGEPFVVPQVAEHGFYGGKPRGDHPFAFRGIDAPLHPLGV